MSNRERVGTIKAFPFALARWRDTPYLRRYIDVPLSRQEGVEPSAVDDRVQVWKIDDSLAAKATRFGESVRAATTNQS